MSRARDKRKDIIKTIVSTSTVRTQEEIIEKLKPFGIEVKQAAISRDVTDLGLKKDKSGAYILPEQYDKRVSENCLKTFVSMSNITLTRALNQVVLHTNGGAASAIGVFIDSEFQEEMLGSIAGDDTLLIICKNEAKAQHLYKKIRNLIS